MVLSNALMINNSQYLVAVYMINSTDVIQIYNRHTNKLITEIKTYGQLALLEKSAKGFYYQVSRFSTPGIIYKYEYNVNTVKLSIFKDMSAESVKNEDYVFDQVDYPSKDGTLVNMFLFHRKDFQKNGKNPALLYAYGGFDVLTGPEYEVLGVFFAKHLNGMLKILKIKEN